MRHADQILEDEKLRLMKKITALAGPVGTKMRDRSRSVKLRVLDIARAARSKFRRARRS